MIDDLMKNSFRLVSFAMPDPPTEEPEEEEEDPPPNT